MFYVYFLHSVKHDETYVGSTNNLRRRLAEHNDGISPATKRYKPWQLVYYEAFPNEHLARMREHNLKHNGNAIRELKKRLGLEGTHRKCLQSGAGYTLIEIIVAIGILAFVFAIILANYRRGGNDSVLSRETNLLMSRIRLAQEQTSAGKTANFCYHLTGTDCSPTAPAKTCIADPLKACTTDAECGGASGSCQAACRTYACCPGPSCLNKDDTQPGRTNPFPPDSYGNYAHTTPEGGYGLAFSCPTTAFENQYNDNHYYNLFTNGDRAYAAFAERRACGSAGAPSPTSCFPPKYTAFNDDTIASDGIISAMLYKKADGTVGSKGDTLKEWYTIDSSVVIADLRLTATNALPVGTYNYVVDWQGQTQDRQHFHCSSPPPWAARQVPSAGNSIPSDHYPIQIGLLFVPPDGRTAMISDNVAAYPPVFNPPNGKYELDTTNPWLQADIMLKLKNRNTDCRVVTVTRSGSISQRTDANCNFAT